MSALFDWCAQGKHARCRRKGQVLTDAKRGTTRVLYCGCADPHCPCAANPRTVVTTPETAV